MKMCIPFFKRNIDRERVFDKCIKTGVLSGVFPGYEELPQNVGFRAIHGAIGWNLFIMKSSDKQYIDSAVYFLSKNRKFVAELLKECKEYIIDFYVEEKDED